MIHFFAYYGTRKEVSRRADACIKGWAGACASDGGLM